MTWNSKTREKRTRIRMLGNHPSNLRFNQQTHLLIEAMLVSSQYPKANLVACISQVSSLSQVLIKININYKKPNPSPLRKPLPLNPGSSRSNRVEMNEHHSLLSLTTCSQVGRKTNYLSHILLPITMINTPTHKVKP